MQHIHTGKYILIEVLNLFEKKIIKASWKDNNQEMTDNIYRSEIQELIHITQTQKPHYIIGDMQNFSFTIDPDTQIWLSTHLFPAYIEVGIVKHALIVSEDLFAQVSIEQTVEEETTMAFETRYFNDLLEALNWLSV